MSFRTETIPTGFDAGYTDPQIGLMQKFIGGFAVERALPLLLHQDDPHRSLWTDGALVGLPGQSGVASDAAPNPRMHSRYLQATGNRHFYDFRAMVARGGEPHPGHPVRIAPVPAAVFFGLPGLPENVRDLSNHTDTVVVAASFPYVQRKDQALEDFPPPLRQRLGRPGPGFEPVEYRPGTKWNVNVLFAVHFLPEDGSAVGRTGLVYDVFDPNATPDVPTALRAQVLAQRGGPAVHSLRPDEVARYLYEAAGSRPE